MSNERVEANSIPWNETGHPPMDRVCDDLKRAGVTKIVIEFDGYGDEGSIESVTFFGRNGQAVDQLPCYTTTDGKAVTMDTLMHAFTYDKVPGGWQNEDGSFGELIINVRTGRVKLNHNWRFMDSNLQRSQFSI